MSLVIAISGATASGKSTLSEILAEKIGDVEPLWVKQDHYFRDFADVPEAERDQAVTSNHPRAVLWDDLVSHVQVLKAGGQVTVPVPGTRFLKRGAEPQLIGPARLILVEGHLLFTEPRLIDLADLKVFVDANVHERVVRRLLRDTDSGKTSLEKATSWYRRDVIPNVSRYSEPMRGVADLIVPFDQENEIACQVITDWARKRLGG